MERQFSGSFGKFQWKFCVTICEVGCYLGLEIKQVGNQIFLNQGSYAKKVLKRFRMESCNACVTPMEQDSKSVDEEIIEDDFPFREAIGSLLYLSVVSRPDIAFAVNKLSQFLDRPQKKHWIMVKRVLRYIKETSDFGILYKGDHDTNSLHIYCD